MPEPLPDQAMLIPLRGRNSNRPTQKTQSTLKEGAIGSLHDPVTWYKITHAEEQVEQRDFQNNAPACLCFGSPTAQLAHQHV